MVSKPATPRGATAALVVTVLSGCTAAYSPPTLPAGHPARPDTAAAPLPPPSTALVEGSGTGAAPEPTTPPRGHEHHHHPMKEGDR